MKLEMEKTNKPDISEEINRLTQDNFNLNEILKKTED